MLLYLPDSMRNFALGLVGLVGLVAATINEEDDAYLNEILREEIPEQTEAERIRGLEESAKRDFGEFDVNGDGQLDAYEVGVKFGGYVNAGDMFHFFTEADSDLTGTVSFDEYVSYIKASATKERTHQ